MPSRRRLYIDPLHYNPSPVSFATGLTSGVEKRPLLDYGEGGLPPVNEKRLLFGMNIHVIKDVLHTFAILHLVLRRYSLFFPTMISGFHHEDII